VLSNALESTVHFPFNIIIIKSSLSHSTQLASLLPLIFFIQPYPIQQCKSPSHQKFLQKATFHLRSALIWPWELEPCTRVGSWSVASRPRRCAESPGQQTSKPILQWTRRRPGSRRDVTRARRCWPG
jgi:hypothetical protein